jgi:hypothetical protein
MVHYLQVNVCTFGDQENQVKILSSLTSTVSGIVPQARSPAEQG